MSPAGADLSPSVWSARRNTVRAAWLKTFFLGLSAEAARSEESGLDGNSADALAGDDAYFLKGHFAVATDCAPPRRPGSAARGKSPQRIDPWCVLRN